MRPHAVAPTPATAHSPVRELEVLHDQLLAQFAAGDPPTPSQIVVLLPDTDASRAQAIVERLRQTIAESHPSFEGALIPVTMTLGVAQFADDDNWHAVVARADEALYRGKAAGRNRVEVG